MQEIKLDLKDKKILAEPAKDARQPNSRIANKMDLSKQAVGYRIDNFVKQGLIKGFYCVINTNKIGYTFYRVALKLNNAGIRKEEEIILSLLGKKHIAWIIKTRGKWDLAIGMWCKNIIEFEVLMGVLLNKFGQFIDDKYFSIALRISDFGDRFFQDADVPKNIVEVQSKEIELDHTDERILSNLAHNSRISLVNLSKKVNISPRLLLYRIKKLEKSEVILAYRPIFDFKKLGLSYYKAFLTLTQNNLEIINELEDFLSLNKQVIYTTRAFGCYDFEFECLFEKDTELFAFIDSIREKFPNLIKNFEILTFEKIFKVSYFPL